jgi:peptidyl-prolyl cis-trans isomerase D
MTMMISKFHKLIQSKIVWGAFAILISVAFVGITAPGSKSRSAARRDQQAARVAGTLFGEEVTRLELGSAYQSVKLNYTLQYGPFRVDDDTEQVLVSAAWLRIAMLKKAAQLGLTVSPDQTVIMIQNTPAFQNSETRQFDARIYSAAVQQIRSFNGMTPKDVENHFAEEVLLRKVVRIPIQGALVTEADILKAFHLYTDKLTAEYAAIPRDVADAPSVTDDDARLYYDQNREDFRMPEKAIVHYVQFPVADLLADEEIADELVAQFYENNKQRFLIQPAEGAVGTAPEFQPFEEVKDSIAEQLQLVLARQAAADLADELVAELADETVTFEEATQKLELDIVKNTPAFSLTDSVKNIDPSAPFQRAAFALENDESHYYSDPVLGRDYVYVISLVKKLPSFVPSFDVVRDDALESARLVAYELAYVEEAQRIHDEIAEAVKTGSSFADAIAPYDMESVTTEPFDITSGLEDEFGEQIIGAAVQCEAGRLTDLIATPDEFLVAYVAEKIPGDEMAALPSIRRELVGGLSNEKSMQLVAAWQSALLKEAQFEDLLQRADDES